MRSRGLLDSFRYAFAGLKYALQTQRNTRIHLLVAGAVIVTGLWLGLTLTQWAVLVLTIGLVLASEMLNTVAETLVDLVSPGYHPLAKVIKDVTAGAVLLMAFFSVIVGMLVLGPPLWERLLGN